MTPPKFSIKDHEWESRLSRAAVHPVNHTVRAAPKPGTRVLAHLLDNALECSPAGGDITVIDHRIPDDVLDPQGDTAFTMNLPGPCAGAALGSDRTSRLGPNPGATGVGGLARAAT